MFLAIIIGFLALLGFGLGYELETGPRVAVLAGAGALGAIVTAVVVQWVTHSGEARDYTEGGVVYAGYPPGRIMWVDWAVVMTRRGTIQIRDRRLLLERRVLCGLIPLATVERSLDDFYRVEVKADRIERERDGYREQVRIDYTLSLVDRKAARVCLLDLSEGMHSEGGSRLVATLREKIDEVMRGGGDRSKRR